MALRLKMYKKNYFAVGAEGAAGVSVAGLIGAAGTTWLFLGTILSATELCASAVYI
jgi:hypothetical protein